MDFLISLALGLCLLFTSCFHALSVPPEVLRRGRGHRHHSSHNFPWFDPTLSVESRARDLVSRLDLEEVVGQLSTNSPEIRWAGIGAYHWRSNAIHGLSDNGVSTVFPQVRVKLGEV